MCTTASDVRGDSHERFHLALRRDHRWHRKPAGSRDESGAVGREAECTAAERVGNDRTHGVELAIGCGTLRRVVAHDVDAYRGVADVSAEVDRRLSPGDG